MNWISICMILICILTARSGYRRGFTKTVVSIVSFMVIVLLVGILNPLLSNLVYNYTELDEKTKAYCVEMFTDEDGEALGRNEQIALIEKMPVPGALKENLQENNNNVIYSMLESTDFSEYIASYMARLFLRIVIFVASIILAILVTKVIGLIVRGVAKMPVLRLVDRIGGLGIGAVKGVAIIWILFLLVTLLSGTAFGSYLYGQIEQDVLAKTVYENNPLTWLLLVFLL